ncbi:DUF3298 domain-containing protein [Methylovulum psychrotolerans]|uniref:DUF3298 and DUF4163 domain-containing protein n=1 Tax=Methylovulum psychrotolerans TaxID=1704499 RepID=UPI001BFFBABA|nr:DUF3298 and DUF4163 domain-containing protein [Methylovulum psychrotolerans]MBT9096477.1 DUF3298 domain-containing protein [Methylovulum psychrotolerans]
MTRPSRAVTIALTLLALAPQAQAAPSTSQDYISNMLTGVLANDEAAVLESQALLEMVAKMQPPAAASPAAQKLNGAALGLIKAGKLPEAQVILAKAYQLAPKNIEIANNYGFVLMKIRDLPAAYRVLSAVIALQPSRANAWRNFGDVLALQGRVDLATAAYLNVYRYSKDRQKTHQLLQNPQLAEDSPDVRAALAKATAQASSQFSLGPTEAAPALSTAVLKVKVEEAILQKGLFKEKDCEPTPGEDPNSGECVCQADISYPVISGLPNAAAQTQLNQDLKTAAEQHQCNGTPLSGKASYESPSFRERGYSVTLHTPTVLALQISSYEYDYHAAHPYSDGGGDCIIDIAASQCLTVDGIFGQHRAAVNRLLYEKLKAMEDTSQELVEEQKNTFISDGKCNGCTVILNKQGLIVLFGQYSVAPYAAGMFEVPIPASYIAAPSILAALGKRH